MFSRSLVVVVLLVLTAQPTAVRAGSPLYHKIYTSLSGETACVRLLSADQEIGCTSAEDGTVGIMYLVSNSAEATAFANAPEDDYIVLLAASMFPTHFTSLQANSHFKGAMIYDDGYTGPISTDYTQPNKNNGLPFANTASWNTVGNGLHWENVESPVFWLNSEDVATVFECYNASNRISNTGENPSYPLCALELNSFMWDYCDALGSLNVWGTLRELNSTDKAVMVTAPADSLAFFHDLAVGADAYSAGTVVAIAIAELLGRPANAASRNLKHNILFSLFSGEAFGYIGSSAMAVDMKNGVFPTSSVGLNSARVQAFVELGQLMSGDTTDYRVFTYDSTPSPAVASTVQTLKDAAAAVDPTKANFVNSTATELPPASLRAFLYELSDATDKDNFPGVVVADHDTTFDNTRYHSLFDVGARYNITSDTTSDTTVCLGWQKLCDLATTMARAVWAMADEIAPSAVPLTGVADCTLLSELMYCLATNVSCETVEAYVGAFGTPGQPASKYVNVYTGGNSVQSGTNFILRALGYALAVDRNVTNGGECAFTNSPPTYGLMSMNDGRCLRTATFGHRALSPAFDSSGDLKSNYDPRYSTWTESVWGKLEAATLGGGVAFLVLSFLGVWLFTRYTVQTTVTESVSIVN